MGTKTVGYEICVIKILPAEIIRGKNYPIRESLPCDDEFGIDGSKAFFPDDYQKALSYYTLIEGLLNSVITVISYPGAIQMRVN